MRIPDDKIPLPELQFRDQAMAWIAKNKTECATIKLGTEEYGAWDRYFEWRGFEPWAMRALKAKKLQEMTVPARWPEWFDLDFAARGK